MKSRWIYTGCDTEDERVLATEWRGLQPAVESRLESLTEVPDDVVFAAHHDAEASPPWDVQAVVTLPTIVCVAEADGNEPQAVLKSCVGQLTTRLEALPSDAPAPHPRRESLESLVPFLQQAREQERMYAFAGFLRPLLAAMHGHAARELDIREVEEDLPAGQWEVDELLDETLLLAWRHWDQRPSSVSLDA